MNAFQVMIVKWVRLGLAAAVLVGAVGCTPVSNPAPGKPGDDDALRVEWTLWEGDYTLVVAQALGLFDKYGVKVQPIYYENFSEVVPDLVSGKLDGSLLGMIDLMNAASRTEMNCVAAYDSGGLVSLATAPDITTAQDLKGKRIGVALGSSGEMVIRDILQRAGLTTRDVVLVNVPVEQVPALLPDQIQAGIVYEPFTKQAIDKGAALLQATEVSALLPDVIVFRSSVAKRNPEKIQAFLRAWFEAVEYRQTHQQFTRGVVAARAGIAQSAVTFGDVDIYNLEDNQILFGQTPSDQGLSLLDVGRLNMDFLISTGSLTYLMDLRKIFDPIYLPAPSLAGLVPNSSASAGLAGKVYLP